MKKILFIFFVFLLSSTVLSAQKIPDFKAFAVRVEKITPKQPNLSSHKNARMFRTNLRNGAKDGINFAGHYVLTIWGCGTNCLESAIMDARTGRVFFPQELAGIGAGLCEGIDYDHTEALDFKPNSRLLVLGGFKGGDLNSEKSSCGIYYFNWTGTALKQVRFIKKKRSETS